MTRSPGNHRRGTVAIAVLIALGVIMALLGQSLVNTMRSSRQLRHERDCRQCEFILEAAAHRVAKEFTGKNDVHELDWKISSAEIVDSRDGHVRVVLLKTEQTRSQWRIVAEYPVGNEWSVRRSKNLWVDTTLKSED